MERMNDVLVMRWEVKKGKEKQKDNKDELCGRCNGVCVKRKVPRACNENG